jgi:3-oxosteroid 1-dehydrogenase
MAILQQYDVTVRLETSLEEILLESGRAVGVVVRNRQGLQRIGANAGIVLCSGGFAHDEGLRRRMHKMSGALSAASADDTGEVIKMADSIGAMTELSDDAWWSSAFVLPNGIPSVSHVERSVPFGFCVTANGERFANESWDYYHFARAMVRRGGEPVWLVFDSRHRKRFPFQGALPGNTPRWMFESGFLKTAGSLSELAGLCGIDKGNLIATAARFNGFARSGVDEDFGRGESRYDRYWGDPAQKPNPNLGAVEQPPFYAAQIHVGDLGTKGGYVTNASAQVLGLDGNPIESLYAAGNVTAPVVGKSYPGPGITLGPAMTFAYLAVEHAALRRTNG